MKNFKYIALTFYIILFFILTSCSNDECYCVETTTEFYTNNVTIYEYWIDECDYPFTSTETYNWGNRITDCR